MQLQKVDWQGAHGVEPWTYRSAVDCSTTELYPQLMSAKRTLALDSLLPATACSPFGDSLARIIYWVSLLLQKGRFQNCEPVWPKHMVCSNVRAPSRWAHSLARLPLLPDASALSCWVSPLARITLLQTTWRPQHSCRASILTPCLVRTLVQHDQHVGDNPCHRASPFVSFPETWITGPATDPSCQIDAFNCS